MAGTKRHSKSVSSDESPSKRGRSGGAVLEEMDGNAERTPSRQRDEEQHDGAEADAPVSSPLRALNQPGKPAECGVIKKVYVENFMCHPKLTVDLNQNINFIHGQNGSGKSAILAAIQICLGAGARRTNRARNLKELVRKETSSGAAPNSAKIRVTVLNDGSDAFKSEVYGKEITVERVISLTGGFNGYKLLDEKGTEKSRDKRELDEMLDALNIQVDNPVAVLDQEEAKKFLMGKPQDKYKFFLKASELERVNRVYSNTAETLGELREAHDKVVQSLETGVRRVENLKEKYQEHCKLQDLENKVQECEEKYAWAIWHEINAKHEQMTANVEAYQKKLAAKQEELRLTEEAANGTTDERDEKTKHIRDLSAEAGEQADKKKKLQAQLKEILAPLKARERELQSIEKREKQTKRALAKEREQLKKLRDEILRNAGSHESEQAQKTEMLQKSETELSELKEKVDGLKQSLSDAARASEDTESRLLAAKNEFKHAKGQLNQVQRTFENLQSSGTDLMARFGGRVAKIHRMVVDAQRRGKFQGPVEGPIGAYLKINPGKEMYKDVVETALGVQILDRFVVTNDRDRKILNELRRKEGCGNDCGIYQVKQGARYNIPGPPVDGIETVGTVLSISNDLVFNCLVDQAKIEKNGLGKSKEESQEKLLTRDASGRLRVRGKISQVHFLPRGDTWSVRGGQLSVMSNDRKPRGLLSKDMGDAIAAAKDEVEHCHAAVSNAETKVDKLEGEHIQKRREWNTARRARKANDDEMDALIERIDQIRTEMENDAPDATADTSVQEGEVQQLEEELEKLARQRETFQKDHDQRQPELDTLRSEIDDATTRTEKAIEELQAAETEMTQYVETQTQNADALQKKRDRIHKYEQKLQDQEEECAEISEEASTRLAMARKLHHFLHVFENNRESCAKGDSVEFERNNIDPTEEQLENIQPPPMDKGVKQYETRLSRIKKRFEEEKARAVTFDETKEEAYQAYRQAQDEMKEKTDSCASLGEKKDALEKDLKSRRKRWKQFRAYLKQTTAIKFSELLGLNYYSGDLEFDDQTESLDLKVSKGGTQSQTKDVKALSGGERSYTTMCLLLAMGETLETPFRILDEFDVFLDPQVRKKTIQSLIHVAKRMEHRQFIFITPQDLTGIKPDPRLKIFKLRPPERHSQQAGGLTQQTL